MIRAFIIEDEPVMAECVALAVETVGVPGASGEVVRPHVEVFNDAVTAMDALRENLPDLILLDVMLTGPDGFTFLNEMISYNDTAKIPVILITTLDLSGRDLSHYGVRRILDKATMTPEDIRTAVRDCLMNTTEIEKPEIQETPGAQETSQDQRPEETKNPEALNTPETQNTQPAARSEISLAELNRRFAELEANSSEDSNAR